MSGIDRYRIDTRAGYWSLVKAPKGDFVLYPDHLAAMKTTDIVEIIPDNLPEWMIKAMAEGQLCSVVMARIKDLEG